MLEAEKPRTTVRLEGLDKLKKLDGLMGNGTGDLPACSIVPKPTTLPRAQFVKYIKLN
jgi:hypothetical protein